MARWLILWGVIVIGMGAGLAVGSALAAEEVKIGYVDAQQVLDRSKAGQVSKAQLEEYVKSRQQLIDVDEGEIRRLEEELKKQSAVLSQEAQREKQESLQRKLVNYQKRAGELSKEVQDRRAEVLKEFNQKLTRALQRVAERGGYAIVLDKEQEGGVVLYAKAQMDLTEQVVAELDRTAPGESAAPAQSGAPDKKP
jgi:outer membrane protein